MEIMGWVMVFMFLYSGLSLMIEVFNESKTKRNLPVAVFSIIVAVWIYVAMRGM